MGTSGVNRESVWNAADNLILQSFGWRTEEIVLSYSSDLDAVEELAARFADNGDKVQESGKSVRVVATGLLAGGEEYEMNIELNN